MTTDYLAEQKAAALAHIERIKALPDGEAQLRTLLGEAMAEWHTKVDAATTPMHAAADALGLVIEDIPDRAMEFPNWLVRQLRIAVGDIEE